MKITSARELLEPGQSAIVFFTHGQSFSIDPSGEGETGEWMLSPALVNKVDRVIVYLRDEAHRVNRIYMGDFVTPFFGGGFSVGGGVFVFGARLPFSPLLHSLSHMTELVTTQVHWLDFGNGSKSPVNYVEFA
jgi:hypothetical protein